MSALTLRPAYLSAGATSVRNLAARMGAPHQSLRRLTQLAQLHTTFLALGGAKGKLGWPLTAPTVRDGGLVARAFEGGELRVAANGAVLWANQRAWTVRFVGLECMRESSKDQSTPSDEPYVMWFVESGTTLTASKREDFNNVNTGTKKSKSSKIDGPDNRLGVPFNIHATVMEWDSGDRTQAKQVLDETIAKGIEAYNEVADQINNYDGSNSVSRLPAPLNMANVGGIISGIFGLEDDYVGQSVAQVFKIEHETAEQFDARIKPPPDIGTFLGQSYSHVIEVVGNPAGRYKLYFDVDIVRDDDPKPVE